MSEGSLRSRRSAAVSASTPLALIAVVALIGAGGSVSFQGTVALALCNLVIVLGLQVFIGNSGVYSFGQLGFAALGAYLGALLTIPAAFVALQTPALPNLIAGAQPGPVATPLISGFACLVLAVGVGLPLMKTSTLAIPISTFAFLIVIYNVLANWDAVTGGSAGLVSIPTTTGVGTAGIWAAGSSLIALAYKWSASGYRLVATREDETAARSLGVAVMRERLIAFALSGLLCGIGGALTVHQSGVLAPDTFYFGATVTTLTMLVLGGSRSVLGAVVGSFAVAGISEILHGVENGISLFGLLSLGDTPGFAAVGLGLVLLATMIAIPGGITDGLEAGELARPRHRMAKRAIRKDHLPTNLPEPAGGGRPLKATGISVAFSGLKALRDVDLTLSENEILGLIGPNGAGKTTLVNVLSGFQKPDAGRVALGACDVTAKRPDRLARAGLTRTFQAALPFPHLSGLENVALGAIGIGMPKKHAVAVARQTMIKLDLPDQLAEAAAGAQPPGAQRLLGIARALATQPRFLLLDEPAAGLNDEECLHLGMGLETVVSEFGCGILLIEHDMDVVMSLCSRIQVLESGETLRTGTPSEIQADPDVAEAYLGSSFVEANLA